MYLDHISKLHMIDIKSIYKPKPVLSTTHPSSSKLTQRCCSLNGFFSWCFPNHQMKVHIRSIKRKKKTRNGLYPKIPKG